jgi:hypothetical protein
VKANFHVGKDFTFHQCCNDHTHKKGILDCSSHQVFFIQNLRRVDIKQLKVDQTQDRSQ